MKVWACLTNSLLTCNIAIHPASGIKHKNSWYHTNFDDPHLQVQKGLLALSPSGRWERWIKMNFAKSFSNFAFKHFCHCLLTCNETLPVKFWEPKLKWKCTEYVNEIQLKKALWKQCKNNLVASLGLPQFAEIWDTGVWWLHLFTHIR